MYTGLIVSTKSLTQSKAVIIEEVASNLSKMFINMSVDDAINRLQPLIDEEDLRRTMQNCGVYYD